jgi:hypothetical protein
MNGSDTDMTGMAERMDAIRLKQMLDPEALTEQELMCLQIEQHGFGCPACPTAEH